MRQQLGLQLSISRTLVDLRVVKEFHHTVVQAIREESPETARRIVAKLKERRARRPSIDLPALTGGPDGDVARFTGRAESPISNGWCRRQVRPRPTYLDDRRLLLWREYSVSRPSKKLRLAQDPRVKRVQAYHDCLARAWNLSDAVERKDSPATRRVRSLKIRAEDARRGRVILMLADGESYSTIEATVPCYRDYINRWRRRFLADRLEGLRPRYRGQPPTVLTPAMEARVLAKTQQPPPDGSTHWSTRKLGRVLKIHHNLIAKTWQRAGLQPHRFERYMQSDNPDFEPKAADVIGLYINPPDHAAVFAVDEKTAIQALDRLDPVLPLSPGRAERHGFE